MLKQRAWRKENESVEIRNFLEEREEIKFRDSIKAIHSAVNDGKAVGGRLFIKEVWNLGK